MTSDTMNEHRTNESNHAEYSKHVHDTQPLTKWCASRAEPLSTIISVLEVTSISTQPANLTPSAQVDSISLSISQQASDLLAEKSVKPNFDVPGVTRTYLLVSGAGDWSGPTVEHIRQLKLKQEPDSDARRAMAPRKQTQKPILHQSVDQSTATLSPGKWMKDALDIQKQQVLRAVGRHELAFRPKNQVDGQTQTSPQTAAASYECRCGVKRKSTFDFNEHLNTAHPELIRRVKIEATGASSEGKSASHGQPPTDAAGTNDPQQSFNPNNLPFQQPGRQNNSAPAFQGGGYNNAGPRGQQTSSAVRPRRKPAIRRFFACPHWKADNCPADGPCSRLNAEYISDLIKHLKDKEHTYNFIPLGTGPTKVRACAWCREVWPQSPPGEAAYSVKHGKGRICSREYKKATPEDHWNWLYTLADGQLPPLHVSPYHDDSNTQPPANTYGILEQQQTPIPSYIPPNAMLAVPGAGSPFTGSATATSPDSDMYSHGQLTTNQSIPSGSYATSPTRSDSHQSCPFPPLDDALDTQSQSLPNTTMGIRRSAAGHRTWANVVQGISPISPSLSRSRRSSSSRYFSGRGGRRSGNHYISNAHTLIPTGIDTPPVPVMNEHDLNLPVSSMSSTMDNSATYLQIPSDNAQVIALQSQLLNRNELIQSMWTNCWAALTMELEQGMPLVDELRKLNLPLCPTIDYAQEIAAQIKSNNNVTGGVQ